MPRITIPLCVNYEAITRPVTLGIARDVMKLCAIDPETQVYMPGEFGQVNQPGTNVGQTDEIRFESFRRVIVTADDSIRNESVMNQIVRQNEIPPIFEDRMLGISVRPVYMESDVTLSFKYTAATRQEAIKWRDEFAVRRAENRTAINHEIKYDIPLQDGLLGLLSYLHDLREKIAGHGEDFNTYFEYLKCRPVSTLGALDGDPDKLLMVVPEKQAPITGWFDFNDIPKENKVDGNSTWEIEFNYITRYKRCTHLYVVYPLMIHQQHISSKYFSSRPRYSAEELPKSTVIGIRALDTLDGNVDSLPAPADGMRIPAYDEWIPAKRLPFYTVPAITWMLSLDPKDSQDLMSLRDLPGMRLSLEFDAYCRRNHDRLGKRGKALALLTLFANDIPVEESIIAVDENLNVRATQPLDLRKCYHIRLSFVTNYTLFDETAVREMQLNPYSTLQAFQSMVPRLDVEQAAANLLDGKYLSRDYIEWFFNYLRDHYIGFEASGDGGPGKGINRGEAGGLKGGIITDPGSNSGSNWNNGYNQSAQASSGEHVGALYGKYVQFLAILSMERSS